MNFKNWKALGHYHEIGGHKIFTIDQGTADEVLLILHGYPTFSFDYHKVLNRLTQKYRVIIHDHLGFGLSDKPLEYSYSLIEQADRALLLWQKLGIKEAHLFAHNYGTSVATEILARREMGQKSIRLKSLTLCNGSMHIELSQLRPIQKLLLNKYTGKIVAKLTSKKILIRNFKKIWGDASKLDLDEMEIVWEMMIYNNGRAVLAQLTQYIRERHLFWHRWIGALQQTTLPINILWATEDPVAVIKMADVLADEIKHSRKKTLSGIGHYPMVEAPEEWTDALLEMLEKRRV